IQPTTNSVTANDGDHTLKVKCSEAITSVQFKVFTGNDDDTTIFDDLKGKGSGESIFDSLNDKSIVQKLSRQDAEQLMVSILDNFDFTITRIAERVGQSSILMFNIKNSMPLKINDFSVTLKIPKDIAKTSDSIRSEQVYEVVEADPVLRFLFNDLLAGDTATVRMVVNSSVTQEMLDSIAVDTDVDLETLLARQRATDEALKISRLFEEYEKDGQIYTKIRMKINPNKELNGLSLYEKIPKCLAKHIDEIEMDDVIRQQIQIINPDPLVMWQFDKLASEEEFSYEVKGVLSEDCKKQLAALGIADELGIDLDGTSMWKIILPLLLIPLIGALIVFVDKFAPRGRKPGIKPESKPAKDVKPSNEEKKSKVEKAPEKKVPSPPPKKTFEEKLDSEIDEVTRQLEESLK
ncbi:MAG: hypothetical protein KKE20_01605, partial [Nanoarchaeota archaeon]|nr:hypothetical protein [Nanoarchaeota archaeon]